MSRSNSHIDHIFSHSESPSREDLLAYAEGRLSKEKAHEIERAMVDDPFLADALEGIALVGSDTFNEMSREVEARIQKTITQGEQEESGKEIPFVPTAAPARKKPIWRWTSIAASVAILVMAGIFLLNDNSGGVMDFIEVPHFSENRGGQNTSEDTETDENLSQYDQAGRLFEEKRYEEALEIFKGLSGSSAKLMMGHTYFQLENFEKAEASFQEVIEFADFNLQDGEYHLALAMIQNGKSDAGFDLLKEISRNKRHAYTNQSKEALKELK